MISWRKLRASSPHLFDKIDVFSQPAAYVDSILVKWFAEDYALHFPSSIIVRDTFGAAFVESSAAATYLAQQLQSWIGAKMTPVLQLTDVEVSAIFKKAAINVKDDLRREITEEFSRLGLRPRFNCGPAEILRITAEAQKRIETSLLEKDSLLKSLRAMHSLSYWPDLDAGHLVRTGTLSWAKDLPENSHRIPASWVEDRYKWVDADGVPLQPEWSSEMGKAALQAHFSYHNQSSDELQIEDVDLVDPEVCDSSVALLQKQVLQKLEHASKESAFQAIQNLPKLFKASCRKRAKLLGATLLKKTIKKKFKSDLAELTGKLPRQEVLQNLVGGVMSKKRKSFAKNLKKKNLVKKIPFKKMKILLKKSSIKKNLKKARKQLVLVLFI